MAKTVTIHAAQVGTGKASLAACTAAYLALTGKRVGLLDVNLESPGLHAIFESEPVRAVPTLNDFLWERATIEQVMHPALSDLAGKGALFLAPASAAPEDVARIRREGYDISLLHEGCKRAIDRLRLDFLIAATHPGLGHEALICAGLSDALLITLRFAADDMEATAALLDVVRHKLDVPDLALAINLLPAGCSADEARAQVDQRYAAPVIAALPFSPDVMQTGGGLPLLHQRDHPWSQQIGLLAAWLLTLKPGAH